MSDKVHPRQSQSNSSGDGEPGSPPPSHPPPSPDKALPVSSPVQPKQPPAGTYVIQIPKDQIYRVPPPENALRYKQLSKPNHKSRTPLRRCCCCCCFSLLILILLLGIAAAVFYFVFRPESPNYTLQSLSIKSLNLSTSAPISPQLDFTLSAHNPNNKISIHYLKPTSVDLFYDQLNLCHGLLPRFHQPTNNVTLLHASLKASAPLQLTGSVRNQMIAAEKAGKVPLTVAVRAAVKFQVGSVKSWTIKVKVRCGVTVDKLTSRSKILSKDCDYSVDVW